MITITKNLTEYPKAMLTALIAFARNSCQLSVGAVEVWAKYTNKNNRLFSGTAHSAPKEKFPDRQFYDRAFVLLRFAEGGCVFPFVQKYPDIKDAPAYEVRNWEELVVALAAHELTHCEQFAQKRSQGWAADEIEAENNASKAIRNYRNIRTPEQMAELFKDLT